MSIKKIAIVSNLRMMLIFLLINDNRYDDILFILDGDLNIRNENKLRYLIKVKRATSKFKLLKNKFKYFFIFTKLTRMLSLKNIPVYGADHITGAAFFLKRNPFFVIEDGFINYIDKAYHRTLKNRIFSVPLFGMHNTVKKIYLTKNNNIPDVIKNKVELIDLLLLWKSKANDKREEILDFFGLNPDKLQSLRLKRFILFTQPLSEDGIISENEKIEIYRSIINNYNSKYLIIKTHPREKTDYEIYFEDVYVLKVNYPSELFMLNGIFFERIITLFSTAVLQYDKSIIDFYGTEVNPKLLLHFGNIRLD
ncbi:glycosyltransferase family 52 [Chelonobacter oris]|uniref:glycosyltransferase family 52 n=1 Tax=Chelonobacter oris TaxID=505317 RepID=UPI002449E1E7|nr:glycosyltransferase family 52 [Chelonobacter oris]